MIVKKKGMKVGKTDKGKRARSSVKTTSGLTYADLMSGTIVKKKGVKVGKIAKDKRARSSMKTTSGLTKADLMLNMTGTIVKDKGKCGLIFQVAWRARRRSPRAC